MFLSHGEDRKSSYLKQVTYSGMQSWQAQQAGPIVPPTVHHLFTNTARCLPRIRLPQHFSSADCLQHAMTSHLRLLHHPLGQPLKKCCTICNLWCTFPLLLWVDTSESEFGWLWLVKHTNSLIKNFHHNVFIHISVGLLRRLLGDYLPESTFPQVFKLWLESSYRSVLSLIIHLRTE